METKSKKTKEVKGGRSALPKGAQLRPADWDVPVTGWCEDVPAVAGVCLVPEEKEEQAAVRAIDHEWKDTTFVTARRLATKNAKVQQVLMELVDTEGKTVGGKVVTCSVTGPAETRGLAKEIAAAAKPRPLVHSARLFMLTPVKEGDSEKDPERMRKVRKWTEQHLKAKVELFPGKVRNGAETFPVVVPPSAVLTALRMSGIEGVFVRTAAEEEDELKVVWLPGASLAEARSMTRLLDTKAVGTTWDPTNKRYGVRAHEDDMTMVTCAVQAQGYGTKTAAPLYVLSGMPSQVNKLDVEGTIATLTREGWAASVVRRIGGKFRTTWLVTAVEPPPVWAFAVPNGVATFAAYNKPEPKQEKKQQASWKLTDWGRPPARPTEDEMADDEAGAETAEGVVTLAQRLRAELGDLRQREEAEKAAKSAVAKKTAEEVRKKKEEELAVKAAKLQTAEQELRSRAEHEREKEASRAGEAQEIKDLFQAQAALHAEQMAAMERQMASQSDFIRQLQATIDKQAEAQQAAQLQLNVQQSQQNRLQLEVQSQAQQPAAPAQADPNAAPVWFQAAMAAQKTEITRSVETSAQLSLGEVRESLKQASTLAQKTTKEISAIAARLSAVEKNPLLTMSRSQDTGAGKGGREEMMTAAPKHVTLATANVTTLNAHLGICSLEADVVALQEVAVHQGNIRQLEAGLRRRERGVVWGPLCTSSTERGGVAVIAKSHVPLRKVDLPANFKESNRVIHAIVPYGKGARMLHVISVYGECGELNRIEELLGRVLQYCASLGDVPIAVMGDFNTRVEESCILAAATDVIRGLRAKSTG